MAYEDEIEQKITGSSFEECKEKLFKAYGKDFRITNKVIDFRPGGFLYLRKKPVTVVTYVVNHQKAYSSDNARSYYNDRDSEEEQLRRNREAILQMQSTNNGIVSTQINKVNDSIEELRKEMTQLCTGKA